MELSPKVNHPLINREKSQLHCNQSQSSHPFDQSRMDPARGPVLKCTKSTRRAWQCLTKLPQSSVAVGAASSEMQCASSLASNVMACFLWNLDITCMPFIAISGDCHVHHFVFWHLGAIERKMERGPSIFTITCSGHS